MSQCKKASSAIWAALFLCAASAGCASFVRRLDYRNVRSPAMRNTRIEFATYLPPGYRTDLRLPLVVFLHGGGDDESCIDRAGLSARFDEAITAGDLPPFVMAVPAGDLGFWADWYDGSRAYETWATAEIPALMTRLYGTAECPTNCHLMGVSMGGEGALRIATSSNVRFETVSVISAPALNTRERLSLAQHRLIQTLIPTRAIFGPPRATLASLTDPFVVWQTPSDLGVSLYLAVGEQDRGEIIRGTERLHRTLLERGIDHAYQSYPGGHNWASWTPVVLDALRSQLSR